MRIKSEKNIYNFKKLKKVLIPISILFVLTVILILAHNLFIKTDNIDENKDINVDIYNNTNIDNRNNEISKYVDTNPVKIGLYIKKNGYFELVEKHKNSWKAENVIGQFYIFPTLDKKIYGSNYKTIWNNYIKDYGDYVSTNNLKTGFNISFKFKNDNNIIEEINQNILTPKDAYLMFPKLMFFIYDDYNYISNVRYYHITNESMKSSTIVTSAKIVGDIKSINIVSDITLTAFTYDTDNDFNEVNKYRGNSYYITTISKTN